MNFSRIAEQAGKAISDGFPVDSGNAHPLTDQQRGLYLAQARAPETLAYNVVVVVDLADDIDLDRLELALHGLIRRNAILRTGYGWVGEPRQVVLDDPPMPALTRRAASDLTVPSAFDLAEPPLIRAFVSDGPRARKLAVEAHHIAVDGISLRTLFAELEALYLGEPLDDPDLTYRDYASWQVDGPGAARATAQEEYWLARFTEPAPDADLPTDFPRATADPLAAAVLREVLGAESVNLLTTLARTHRASLSQVLLALHLLFLARVTGAETVTAGTPLAGRDLPAAETTIGMFTRTVPIRCRIDPDLPFADFLRRVRDTAWEAISHQEYPFTALAEKIAAPTRADRHALFDSIVSVQHDDVHDISFLGQPIRLDPSAIRHAMFDLNLQLYVHKKSLEFLWVYRTGLFLPRTVEAFHQIFAELAGAAAGDASAPLGRLVGRDPDVPALPEIDFDF